MNFDLIEYNLEKQTVKLSRKCVVTGKPHSITIPTIEYNNYMNGQLIQVAMPSVSAEDREFILTGMSPEGWSSVITEEPEDDEI